MSLLLSTAYAPPLGYMALLYAKQGEEVCLEACEYIVKQSWRNRCDVASSQGIQSLSIPIERPQGAKTLIRDVRIDSSKPWQHQHKQALKTNYSCSPFFEFYWDELYPLYDKRYQFLWDFNWDLLLGFIGLLDLDIHLNVSNDFLPLGSGGKEDYRYTFHPRTLERSALPYSPAYYQPFAERLGFMPELSIYDLLMNLGPESQIYLRDYATHLYIKGL